MSVFADGAWYVLGDSDDDQTIVRLGVKFPF
jgi:hypothetical protein